MDKRKFLQASGILVCGAWLTQKPWNPGAAMAATNDKTFPLTKTDTEWQQTLESDAYRVLRQHGTERPNSSPLDKVYEPGTYVCAGCDLPLFTGDTKFDSGTGWPSFFAPIKDATEDTVDKSFFMSRTEVHCSRCGGHLGHVFNDGPKPTGLRYCMNGVSLKFIPAT
jgi:peptide-methionine (R)-S-oxide reductase